MKAVSTLVPAYGRDYRTAKEARRAFASNVDFVIADYFHPYDGKPCNRPQLIECGQRNVSIRFDRLQRVTVAECADTTVKLDNVAARKRNKGPRIVSKRTAFGTVARRVEGWRRRAYVQRSKGLNTYFLTSTTFPDVDSMIAVGGEYHWRTLAELRDALACDTQAPLHCERCGEILRDGSEASHGFGRCSQ